MNKSSKFVALLCITVLLFLVSAVLCFFTASVSEPVILIVIGLTTIANILMVWFIDESAVKTMKWAWIIFPIIQFILLVVSPLFEKEVTSYYGYSRYSSSYSYSYIEYQKGYFICNALAYLMAAMGISTFLTLLGRKKAWKMSRTLLVGLGVLVLTAIAALIMLESGMRESEMMPYLTTPAMYVSALIAFSLFYIYVYICNQFKAAAADKGYEGRRFFWLPFFFSFIGFLLVVALPNKKLTDIMQRLTDPGFDPSSGQESSPQYSPDMTYTPDGDYRP